jgi:hypothetical protein
MDERHPIRLIVRDDGTRNRLTVFFRYFLALPHSIWSTLWGIGVLFVAIGAWFAALIAGSVPAGMHGFMARWLRYSTRVSAYSNLLADPFPPFDASGTYPVDLEVDGPRPQSRLVTGFRWILAIPAWIVAAVYSWVLGLLAFVAWLVCLFTGRMPEGLESAGTYLLEFMQQTSAYSLLLSDRYPSFSSTSGSRRTASSDLA